MAQDRTFYRPEIDGLRAVAVAAVVINHFDHHLLPSGYLGVDIFFIISGYVITSSMARHRADSLAHFYLGFFARRARRLVAALVACVALTGLAVWALDLKPEVSLPTGASALFGVSNFYLLRQSSDYFAPASALNAFTQTWSLGVEEQFYVLYPALVWAAGIGRSTAWMTRLFWATLALSGASLAGFEILHRFDQTATYYLMPTRFWELGTGVVLYLLSRRGTDVKARNLPNASNVAFLLLVAILFVPEKFGAAATVGAVFLAGLLVHALRPETRVYAVLTSAPAQFLGRISYSLYLWHWSVISISRWTVGISWKTAPFQVAIMLLGACASHYLLESPIRRAAWFKSHHWRSLGVGLGASAATAISLAVLAVASSPKLSFAQAELRLPAAFLPVRGNNLSYVWTCAVDDDRRPFKPDTVKNCYSPPQRPGGQSIWTLGDSHAGHLQGLLYSLAERLGVGVFLAETPGRPFPPAHGESAQSTAAIYAEVHSKFKPEDILLLGRLFFNREGAIEPMPDVPAWVERLSAFAGENPEIQIVVMGPAPIFKYDTIRSCEWRHRAHTSCDLPRDSLAPAIESVMNKLSAAVRAHPNLHLFNSFAVLCPAANSHCSPIADGVALYRDADHLNSFGSARLERAFVDFLRQEKLLKEDPANVGRSAYGDDLGTVATPR